MDFPSRYVTVAVLVGFTVALFIHSQQTETTSRLDFLWKLQAHGKYISLLGNSCLYGGNICCWVL